MKWRILTDSSRNAGRSGAWNMAVDEAILSEVEAGRSPPTVRVYGWTPACISLGHSQKAAHELDLDRVRSLGYDIVVRATGGRAVLHIDELTYSVIAPNRAETWCETQPLSYRTISQAVAQALADAGFGVSLDRGYPVEKPLALRAMTPCFSSTARSEVVWGDRKVVGSAQRRMRDSFLQHGSILVSKGHRNIVDCLNLEADNRARYLEILDRNAVSLEEALGRTVRWDAIAKDFEERFVAALEIDSGFGGLNEIESRRVDELMGEKVGHGELLKQAMPGNNRFMPEGMRS